MTHAFFLPKPKLKPESNGTDIAPGEAEELLLMPYGVGMFNAESLYAL